MNAFDLRGKLGGGGGSGALATALEFTEKRHLFETPGGRQLVPRLNQIVAVARSSMRATDAPNQVVPDLVVPRGRDESRLMVGVLQVQAFGPVSSMMKMN